MCPVIPRYNPRVSNMPLASGVRLGPYEILSALGAGGMGEVYRARDTKLNRDVALKVLPADFALDADRLTRFKREAQLLASLNHPNIAAIYGFEDSGETHALVLELVEGETLADRIARGPVPLDEALPIARQICEALEAAHELGIIHRDLKPANIKQRPDGMVKVLDFGLAKLAESAGSGQPAAGSVPLSLSPTITSPAMMTGAGVLLGTAAYMSPEQARGKAVDKRADIWAFGCVLFEMLTGTRPFGGDEITDVIVASLTKEPDWTKLPASTPLRLRDLLQRCLRKDTRDRLRDIGDARLDIVEAAHLPGAQQTENAEIAAHASRRVVAVMVAAAAIVAAVGIDIWVRQLKPGDAASRSAAPLIRTTIDLPSNAQLALGTHIPQIGFDSSAVALSPDGRHLAYVGQSPSGTMLYLRDISGFDITPIAGTEGAIYAFFSPDSGWLGFLTNDKVKKVSLEGGAPVTLCDARGPVRATWTRDGSIYIFEDQSTRLSRVPATGGTASGVGPLPVSNLFTFSQVLPDGQWALATDAGHGISADYADVKLVPLAGGDSKVLIHSGYDARYVPPGYLFFGRAGNLLAVRFDPVKGEVVGDPLPVVSGASMESFFAQVHASASDNGLLAYVPGGDRAVGRLAWVDRQGRTDLLPSPALTYGVLDLAPKGDRVAVHVGDVTDYVLVYDLNRGEGRRLASTENTGWPVWNPDNRTIAFTAWQQSHAQSSIVARAVDDAGPLRRLLEVSTEDAAPSSWSPDGKVLAYYFRTGRVGLGFLFSGSQGERVVSERANQWGPDFSPDGRWVAYVSDETGRYEVFVRSYPDGKTIRQITVDGGVEPVWCPCGELFYRNGNRWMSVKIRTLPDLQWDSPQLAFQTDFIDTPGRSYDVSPDGKRLLVVKRAEADVRDRINLVANWTEALERLVLAK